MCKNISRSRRLLIVSDTAVYKRNDGCIEAFEPVVREIEHFGYMFDSITWIASRCKTSSDFNGRIIEGVKVNYILFNQIGGSGLCNFFKIIFAYLKLIFIIPKHMVNADVIHSRGPSHPAIICVFFSFLIKHKIYWHKYAGNWGQLQNPFSYASLKWLLNRAHHSVVTINGAWEDQKKFQLTFENPTITDTDRIKGKEAIKKKNYSNELDLVFIGRLEDAKGVQRILNVLSRINSSERIGCIHFIGNGKKRLEYEEFAKENCHHHIIFHGYLSRIQINEILCKSHIFLLPSDSEGFPKVIAEAANYGVIPLVSDISSIGQYVIDGENGFLLDKPSNENMLYDKLLMLLKYNNQEYQSLAMRTYEMASKFTYSYYNHRILVDILHEEVPIK